MSHVGGTCSWKYFRETANSYRLAVIHGDLLCDTAAQTKLQVTLIEFLSELVSNRPANSVLHLSRIITNMWIGDVCDVLDFHRVSGVNMIEFGLAPV